MAKNFGMRFASEPEAIEYDYAWLLDAAKWGQTKKYFIYSNSVKLLEPQIGDFVSDKKSAWALLSVHKSVAGKISHYQIFQRNGIAFMFPEVEND